jgi:hypothetical protein
MELVLSTFASVRRQPRRPKRSVARDDTARRPPFTLHLPSCGGQSLLLYGVAWQALSVLWLLLSPVRTLRQTPLVGPAAA